MCIYLSSAVVGGPSTVSFGGSVTRLGNLLDFGQLFKAFGHNYFAQIFHILRQFFVKVSKSLIFLVKSFLGNFYKILAIFSGHTA